MKWISFGFKLSRIIGNWTFRDSCKLDCKRCECQVRSGVCQREHVVMRSKVFCIHRDRNVFDWGPQGQMGFLTVLYPKPTYFLFVL